MCPLSLMFLNLVGIFVSQVVAIVAPILRRRAGLGDWQVLSRGQGNASGMVVFVPTLRDVQEVTYRDPVLLFVKTVGGEEEVPNVRGGNPCDKP